MRCPYFLCNRPARETTDGKQDYVATHLYEGYTTCPGSLYVTKPANRDREERLMAERAVASKLPRGLNG